jgi:hypothetical protein
VTFPARRSHFFGHELINSSIVARILNRDRPGIARRRRLLKTIRGVCPLLWIEAPLKGLRLEKILGERTGVHVYCKVILLCLLSRGIMFVMVCTLVESQLACRGLGIMPAEICFDRSPHFHRGKLQLNVIATREHSRSMWWMKQMAAHIAPNQSNDHWISAQRSFFNILDSMKDLHENRDNALKWYSSDSEKIGL